MYKVDKNNMFHSDPIADMLTRIRNALLLRRESVEAPYSKVKENILEALKRAGFIHGFKVSQEEDQIKTKTLQISLKYSTQDHSSVISTIKRISKPSRRVYTSYKTLPSKKLSRIVKILSTSQGIKIDYEAKEKELGGEILLEVS